MKLPLSSRFIAAAVLATAALGAASAAQARPDIQVTIGWPGQAVFVQPPAYVRSEPVFVQPPAYVRSEPVFVQPRPIYRRPPVVVYERPWQPSYRPEFERERAWRHAEWQRRDGERREWERRHHDRSPSHGHDRD